MDATDQLEAKARLALDRIDIPAVEDVTTAVEEVCKAAASAKKREDSTFVTASRGNYQPESLDFAWIAPYFEKFYERQTSSAAAMADELGRVRNKLVSQRSDTLNVLSSTLDGWSGTAKDSFNTNFVAPLPDAIKNQTEVVDELRSAMWAYQAVLGRARVDAMKVADKTALMLEALEDLKVKDAPVTLAVVGSAAALLSTIARGSVLQLSLASARESVNTASVSAEQEIDGHDVASVLDSMKNLLDRLEKAMDEEESNLGRELAKTNERVDEILAAGGKPTGTQHITLLPAELDTGTPKPTEGPTQF